MRKSYRPLKHLSLVSGCPVALYDLMDQDVVMGPQQQYFAQSYQTKNLLQMTEELKSSFQIKVKMKYQISEFINF